MDEEQKDQPQVEAEQNNAIPEQVQVAATDEEALKKYSDDNEKAKDKLSQYGFTDVEQFVAKVASDSVFARAVVKDYLGVSDGAPVILAKVGSSPQEKNITGVLDHSEYPAKLKEAPDASVPDENATEKV
jgi:hypothetical protein